eukprot:tig00021036_g17271.t1
MLASITRRLSGSGDASAGAIAPELPPQPEPDPEVGLSRPTSATPGPKAPTPTLPPQTPQPPATPSTKPPTPSGKPNLNTRTALNASDLAVAGYTPNPVRLPPPPPPLEVNEEAFVPLELVKQKLTEIVGEMEIMKKTHVETVSQIEQTFNMIENETQAYFIEFIKEMRDKAKERAQQFRVQLAMQEAEIGNLRSLKAGTDATNATLRQKVADLMAENESLLETVRNERGETDKFVESVKERYEKEIRRLRQQTNEEAEDEVNRIQLAINEHLSGLKIQHEAAIAALSAERGNAHAELATVAAERDTLLEQAKELSRAAKAAVDERDALVRDKEAALADLAAKSAVEEQLAALQKEHEELRTKLAEAQEAAAKLETEHKEARTKGDGQFAADADDAAAGAFGIANGCEGGASPAAEGDAGFGPAALL